MSQYSIVDLFYAANKLHQQHEQQQGRKMVPPNQEGSSQLVRFPDGQGRTITLLLETRGDRQALNLFGEVLQQYENVSPTQLQFIVEGYGRRGVAHQRYTAHYLAEEMAHRYGIPLAGGISSITDWEVMSAVINECAEIKPLIPRKKVIGWLVLTDALKRPACAKRDIPEAIELLASSWNQGEQRVTTISELYNAAERVEQMTTTEKKKINSVFQAIAKRNNGRLDLEEWTTASEALDEAAKAGAGREVTLGSMIHTVAALSDNSFPDFVGSMNSLLMSWHEGVGREELHKCLIHAQAEFRKSSDAFRTLAKRIGEVAISVQNRFTAQHVRETVNENTRAKHVLIVAGTAQERGIRAAFPRSY